MLRTWILAGYFMMMSYLQTSGKINQYINPKYQYLTKMTMCFAMFLAIIQLIKWVKEGQKDTESHSHEGCDEHHHGAESKISRIGMYFLVSLPVLVVFLLPTVNLDASIVEAKGFNFPISKDSTSFGDIEQQYLKPNTHIFFNDEDYDKLMQHDLKEYINQDTIEVTDNNYLKVMELIYNYPQKFVGKKIEFKGFVYNDPTKETFFLFRFGILHCVADSGVYGLMIDRNGLDKEYKANTWLTIRGTIDTKYYEPFSQVIPMVKADKVTVTSNPSNEYVYRIF
ncbi:TIGR03943 family putative permease subunit [Vagococcus intermedius]|uniref:TIGR03943 family protein n=1 Tax=Vagococcus intermedius TaxID=2991418 RepID=A0AAF0I5K2_9ENTE|nr:TIGR03943 family protein [Vagococcus intermedius]WEG73033.1 TIGR03943 family protein [Vagococcus intermedius]WEG75118.1 TIGR03943 family protein [Vagococcus intermedius]